MKLFGSLWTVNFIMVKPNNVSELSYHPVEWVGIFFSWYLLIKSIFRPVAASKDVKPSSRIRYSIFKVFLSMISYLPYPITCAK